MMTLPVFVSDLTDFMVRTVEDDAAEFNVVDSVTPLSSFKESLNVACQVLRIFMVILRWTMALTMSTQLSQYQNPSQRIKKGENTARIIVNILSV